MFIAGNMHEALAAEQHQPRQKKNLLLQVKLQKSLLSCC